MTLEAICWQFRTGSPWRDIPDEFGAWQPIWERHQRWSIDRTHEAMVHAVHATNDVGDDALAALVSIDSTSVPAHQHAAKIHVLVDGTSIRLGNAAGHDRCECSTIPERCDQTARRKEKGSQGGRPPAFDPALYRHRNTVECGFN